MATATLTHLVEYASALSTPREVDSEAGVIEDVKILGVKSKNGRTYSEAAMQRAIGLYEGAKVNVNHRDPKSGGARGYQDRLGVLEGIHFKPGEGLFAKRFRFNPKHALAEQLIWDAKNAPGNVGFSHDAEGTTTRKNGTTVVEDIHAVNSVDLVADPATTAGMFESEQKEPKTMKTTVKELVESLTVSDDERKLLNEAVSLTSGATEVELSESDDDQAKASLAVFSLLGDALKALTEAKEQAPPPADDDIKGQLAELKEENAKIKAKSMLLESGREATEPRIKALAACDEAGRKELLESWPTKAEPGKRPKTSPPVTELTEGDESDADFPRDNPERFAAMLR